MKRFFLVIILSFSMNVLSDSKPDQTKILKQVARNFLTAVMSKDKELYQKSVSKKFYADQVKEGFIKQTFSSSKKKIQKFDFDFTYKKGAVDKDFYFINIKEKSDKKYPDSWFVVRKNKENKFVIDGLHHFED